MTQRQSCSEHGAVSFMRDVASGSTNSPATTVFIILIILLVCCVCVCVTAVCVVPPLRFSAPVRISDLEIENVWELIPFLKSLTTISLTITLCTFDEILIWLLHQQRQ